MSRISRAGLCLATIRYPQICPFGVWCLCALLVVVLSWVSVGELAHADNRTVSAEAAHRASKAGDLLLIDVRSQHEWQATGLPESAVAVTIHQPGGSRAFYEAVMKAVGSDKGRPIGLICAAGVRSHRAMGILSAAGFSDLKNVAEGMDGSVSGPGWRRRGLPVSRWSLSASELK